MPKIVECVPNFSEGRSKEAIEGIANAIGNTPGCTLLDVDPGVSTNRTVYTFVGSPEDVVKGALAGALAASQLIDMRGHTGEHLRLGALDVCPFIPVQDVSMEECVVCANRFAEALGATLNVPVYLYGHASTRDYRKTVTQIRAGEYEGLEDKLEKTEWEPDYGPAQFVPSWGATIAGARDFLIAYNVNLLGTKEQAHRISCIIREQGAPRPERLAGVQAMGWYLQEANLAQISMNLSNINLTPMHVAYEAAVKQAQALKLSVVGSEVVGVLPKSALIAAADFYIERDGLFILEEEQKIRLAIDRLGLNSYKHFEPKEKVIEFMLHEEDSEPSLTNLLLKDFVRAVSNRTPVPGGGSVAALVGALGSGLSSMAALLTYGYKRYEDLDPQMRRLIPPLHKLSHALIPKIDADSYAFSHFMEASKLPANTAEEKERKKTAEREALYNAIAVPFSVAKDINTLWDTLKDLAPIVNIQCLSDVQVGVRCLQTAVWSAYYNVLTNAKNVEDAQYKDQILTDIKAELKVMEDASKTVLGLLDSRD
ncbi:formimidoyltransferase-cyclodeaminase-like [Watersipora subatra]|uniref:formimidoyltransferase-cyclodeaminase-like n=1 Tax=Watersipora subatra TaxID=2589382 RepID=UPI00355BADA9